MCDKNFSRSYSSVIELNLSMRTLIREGISGTLIQEGISVFLLISQCPTWRAHEDMSRELTLAVTHYGELTLSVPRGSIL
jgi:hypothetical protein